MGFDEGNNSVNDHYHILNSIYAVWTDTCSLQIVIGIKVLSSLPMQFLSVSRFPLYLYGLDIHMKKVVVRWR